MFLQNRQSANVIKVRMRDHNAIGGVERNFGVARNGIGPFFFWVHPRIEDNEFIVKIKRVGISANFWAEIK